MQITPMNQTWIFIKDIKLDVQIMTGNIKRSNGLLLL
jgi:hypothetical protein